LLASFLIEVSSLLSKTGHGIEELDARGRQLFFERETKKND